MANFNTHFVGAASVSAIITSTLLVTNQFSVEQGVSFWIAGCVGGFLPDLDSDVSPVLKGMFTLLGLLAALTSILHFIHLPLLVLWGVALGLFLLVRFGLMTTFAKLTRHRGSFHSILAAISFGLGSVYLCQFVLDHNELYSWMLGFMVFCGYITHLVLDECYAVDLSGFEFKNSFGTALKPVSLRYWKASLVFLGLTAYFIWQIPQPQHVDQLIQALIERPDYV